MRTEEEQIELIKNIWQRYGVTLVIAACALLAVYFGTTTWKTKTQQHVGEASQLFEQWTKATDDSNGMYPVNDTYKTLIAEYDHTVYAVAARLHRAKIAMDDGLYPEAQTQLLAILSRSPDAEVASLAHFRLAQVYVAMEKYDQALTQLTKVTSSAFTSSAQELEGDIHWLMGDASKALNAYQKAASTNQLVGFDDQELTIKIQALDQSDQSVYPINR